MTYLKMTSMAVLPALLLGLWACSLNLDEEDIEEVIDACGGMTFEELKTANDISIECKASIQNLLPDDESNLAGSRVAAGSAVLGDTKVLLFLGADDASTPINWAEAAEITLTADGVVVPETAYTISFAADLDATLVSISAVLDYSASMEDLDIDDAIEIFELIFSIPVGTEAEYTIFSETVLPKIDFTSDNDALLAALQRDDAFERQSTALFDAMGLGIASVSERTAPVKLLVVATDGGENASTIYTDENTLYQMANQGDVHIIVLGSLFSDLDFMKRAAQSTNGFYFYSRAFGSLKGIANGLIDLLENMGAVQITDSTYADAAVYELTVDGARFTF